MTKVRRRAATILVFGCAVVLFGLSAAAAENRVDKVSSGKFSDTVERLETAIKKRGLMIVATIDHQNMLRMVGASTRGSKTLEFGKPDMMKMLLPGNPEIGLEMPLKIYVYERGDGKTVLSFYRPSSAYATYGKEELTKAGQMMEMMLEEITTEAAR